jgi:hypothetical protein
MASFLLQTTGGASVLAEISQMTSQTVLLHATASIIRHFPDDFISGTPVRFDTFLEALLYNSSPLIPRLHLNINSFSPDSACHEARNTKKASYVREKTTFSYCFGIPGE